MIQRNFRSSRNPLTFNLERLEQRVLASVSVSTYVSEYGTSAYISSDTAGDSVIVTQQSSYGTVLTQVTIGEAKNGKKGKGNQIVLNLQPGITQLTIDLGPGNDKFVYNGSLPGNECYVSIYGGDGDDTISIFATNYVNVFGGRGNDTITSKHVGIGYGSYHYLDGGDGNDTMSAEGCSLFGGNGNDTLVALGRFQSYLNGGADDDILQGARHISTSFALGEGNDKATGGNADDYFYLSSAAGTSIVDGGAGIDYFSVPQSVWDKLKPGQYRLRNVDIVNVFDDSYGGGKG